ncbi:MAG: molybdate ABC transporter substrate-binding protein [Paracoccaceae bacterium]
MKKPSIFFALLWLGLITVANPSIADTRLKVFAAASLRGVLVGLINDFGKPVAVSYGGSGTMARQVAQGAPADLIILANPMWDLWLSKNAPPAIDREPSLATNGLVLIGGKDQTPFKARPNANALLTRLNGGRIAMGQRDSVPAGQYARAWLETHKMWAEVSPHIAETQNVRMALTLVHRGEAPLGIVYLSDTYASDAVHVLWHIDPATHPSIRYPARAMTSKGAELLEYLRTPSAKAVFANHGFLPEQGATN